MLGTLIRLALIILSIMILLNILAPNQAKKVINSVSESADLNEELLQKGLDGATELTKEGFSKTADIIKEKLEENKQ